MLDRWIAFRDYLSDDFLGGPKVLKMAWVVNLQKGATLPFVLALMWAYDNWSTVAWTYAALHGGYGLCWLLKDALFPDPNWEKRITFGGAVMAWVLVLGLYWLFPWLLISRHVQVSPALLAGAVLLHTLGVVIMMCADAQKNFTLKVRRGLITTGWFARVRHPNYLGEMMLYGAYALLVQHWVPWLVLAWVWTGVFLPNMITKERSMSRYPEWPAYHARSGFLLPKIGFRRRSASAAA